MNNIDYDQILEWKYRLFSSNFGMQISAKHLRIIPFENSKEYKFWDFT